jgi:hypothetical protein
MRQISNAQGRHGGKELAIAGLVPGVMFVAIYGLFIVAIGTSA